VEHQRCNYDLGLLPDSMLGPCSSHVTAIHGPELHPYEATADVFALLRPLYEFLTEQSVADNLAPYILLFCIGLVDMPEVRYNHSLQSRGKPESRLKLIAPAPIVRDATTIIPCDIPYCRRCLTQLLGLVQALYSNLSNGKFIVYCLSRRRSSVMKWRQRKSALYGDSCHQTG